MDAKKYQTKLAELTAIATAHITRCPYCIDIHTKKATESGATEEASKWLREF